jgi:hypothetical protein
VAGLSLRNFGFDRTPVLMGLVVGRVAPIHVFLKVLQFSHVIIVSLIPHYDSVIYYRRYVP